MKVANLKNKEEKKDYLETARHVLRLEADALMGLSKSLNHEFRDAIDVISNIEGRVVITGMGKSGHIARKIAATMASTGTPAFFVHPGEASHGDMGMIVRGDVVIAISNSGESKELGDLIEYTRRFAIPLIGITSFSNSTLGGRSDICLLLPNFPEACPNGLAPTTSTTLTLALGDAMAVTLLEKKGFTAKDFQVFHPGGKLGQQLMLVSEIMHMGDNVPLVTENEKLENVVSIISDKGFGCVGVQNEEGKLIGMITDGDLRRQVLNQDILSLTAIDIMTENPKVIYPETLVGEAMGIMNDVKEEFRKITVLFVTDENNFPKGLLHMHDCLRAGFS